MTRLKFAQAFGCNTASCFFTDFTMPQPIDKIIPEPHCKLNTRALENKPKMAFLVTQIFAVWARIEQDLDVLLVNVLGADATPALAIFATLIAQHLKSGALEAAAKAELSAEDFEVFKAAISVVDVVQTPRNHLAHWSWGTCEQRPELLVLANPKMLSARDLRVAKVLQKGDPQLDPMDVGRASLFDNSEILAYTEADLERALRDLNDAQEILNYMINYIDPSWVVHFGPHIGVHLSLEASRDELLQKLNGQRLFREALDRIHAGRKSNQKSKGE
jgi:hypothetical protein